MWQKNSWYCVSCVVVVCIYLLNRVICGFQINHMSYIVFHSSNELEMNHQNNRFMASTTGNQRRKIVNHPIPFYCWWLSGQLIKLRNAFQEYNPRSQSDREIKEQCCPFPRKKDSLSLKFSYDVNPKRPAISLCHLRERERTTNTWAL